MMIPKTVDAVTFSQDPGGVRARAGTITYLFIADQPAVEAAYTSLAAQARDYFEPRLLSSGEPFGEGLTDEIARLVALDQAWRSQVNRRPIDAGPRSWGELVSVRRIVADIVSRAIPRQRDRAAALTAHLLVLSPEVYAAWQEGERRQRER